MRANAIERGSWVRIVSGPLHRRDETREGVVDASREYPSGLCWRVINPHTRRNWGWINARDLRPIPAPAYQSPLTPEMAQRGLDLLRGKR